MLGDKRLCGATASEKHRRRFGGFLRALHEEGRLSRNPWPDHVKTKTPSRNTRHVPSKVEMERLLEAAGRCPQPCRTRAILELGYGCGLRRMELHNLNIDDISGDAVRIRGKGGKERLVPLGVTARTWLEQYIYGDRLKAVKTCNPLESALFVTKRGVRLGIESYQRMMELLRKESGNKGVLGKKWTQDKLRYFRPFFILRR